MTTDRAEATTGALPARPGLRSLDADALAALANRGLVKRATREIERDRPRLSADGTAIVAEFGDGVRATLPEGGLDQGRCSCGATGVCRHLIGLILAYQSVPAAAPAVASGAADGRSPVPAGTSAASDGASTDSAGGPAASGDAPEVLGGAPVVLGGPVAASAAPAAGISAAAGQITGNVAEVASGAPSGGQPRSSGTSGASGTEPVTGAAASPIDGLSAATPVQAEAGEHRGSWSPGTFSDDDLIVRIGARLVTVARRTERAGYTARVRRGPVPVVELPAATVRFLAPHDLGYVHTDARAGVRDDVIALAVWAFRAADVQQPGVVDCVVDVGGSRDGDVTAGSGLEAVVEFAAEVLRAGAVHAGAGLSGVAAARLTELEKAGMRWPLDATAELADQLTAYRDRSAGYAPELLADLIAELFARHRAVTADSGAAVRARVLGSEEAAETPLRRVRLDGLGARVTAVDGERRIEIFHGQPASGVVLVSHRQWTTADDGPALSRRRIAGTTVGAVAGGVLVTESAVRSASRAVRMSAGRVAKSTVTVSNGAWDDLPSGLLVRDYAALATELDRMPPRPVRARVRAELVRVLAIAEVGDSHYSPGSQRLTVEIRDDLGNTATVLATHASVTPGRLDAVAAALSGRRGTPRFVAGSVHRTGGGIVIDPYAIAADGPPIVPDLIDSATLDRPAAGLSAADGGPGSGGSLAGAGPAVDGSLAGAGPAVGGSLAGAGPVAGGSGADGRTASGTSEADDDPDAGRFGDGADSTPGSAGGANDPGELSGAYVALMEEAADPLAEAVATAREVLAEAAHSGLAHLPAAYAERLRSSRVALARVGLHRVASALDEVAARLSPDPGTETCRAWVDAYLRVSLAADLL
jgi:hypothetical protein